MAFWMPRYRWWALIALTAFVVGVAHFALLNSWPVAQLDQAQGIYKAEVGREGRSFHWTSSRVRLPLAIPGPAVLVNLGMAAEPWDGRTPSVVTLATEAGSLGSFAVIAPRRHYWLLIPGSASTLLLQTNLNQPSQLDRRWVGVQVFTLEARPLGPPSRAAQSALLIALASILALLAARWIILQGYGALTLLTILALALRTVLLQRSPPGAHHDEMVSLVDAWYLLHTARDHHGNLLPLGAFEAFGDWISPLMTYLELPLVAMAGGPLPLAGRLLTALIGTLAVPLIYGLARELALPKFAALSCALSVAVSPWQISLSRTAIPPALVFVILTLCLWAGLRLLRNGTRRAAWGLALAAGVGLYAYPTLKLVLPLLVTLTVALALLRHARTAARNWLLPSLALVLLWTPFITITLFNASSGNRFNYLAIKADSPLTWLASWLANYSFYFGPDFYYRFDDGLLDHGYLRQGVQLWAEAPLMLIGVATLLWCASIELRAVLARIRGGFAIPCGSAAQGASLLLLGALLLAPLPTSLTWQNPHNYRAASIAPLYTLLLGMGTAALWRWSAQIGAAGLRRAMRVGTAALFGGLMLAQSAVWFNDYMRIYPLNSGGSWLYQDGLIETMGYAVAQADGFTEVWSDSENSNKPYIYLLAALPAPITNPQTQLRVVHGSDAAEFVEAVGRYRFVSLNGIPYDLPTHEAILDQFNRPAYLIQEWQSAGHPVLLVRPYP